MRIAPDSAHKVSAVVVVIRFVCENYQIYRQFTIIPLCMTELVTFGDAAISNKSRELLANALASRRRLNQRVEGPSGGTKFQVRNGASASRNSRCF